MHEAAPEAAAVVDPSSMPVLDIGGDIGALVVHLAAAPPSGELELQPVGDAAGRFHTGVHRRRLGDRLVEVAVFPEVHEGRYEVLDERGLPIAEVDVRGGEVAEIVLGPG